MIKIFKRLFRLFQINFIIAKYGLDRVILPKNHISYYFTYLNPWNFRRDRKAKPYQVKIALEKLGPIFIKFGQLLSTRPDLISSHIIEELSQLQDRVTPFPFSEAKNILERLYQKSIEEVFSQFNPIPLASASIAQVHSAMLPTGEQVVVKILRPHIHTMIARDVGLLYAIAKLVQYFLPKNSGLNLSDLVSEFEQSLLDELDLVKEGANASVLRRHFLASELLYIPQIYWAYTHQNVLVMERIYGIPIYDISQLKDKKISLKELAEKGIEVFFTQVFRDSFFHADMHPGNIFVSNTPEGHSQYIFVDFGIVGTLDAKDQYYIAENLMAFLNRDYRRVALLHVESGWLLADADKRQFEASIRTACEPIFDKPLKEISLAHVLIRLFQTARRFNIQIQPQLLLLQKTLLNLEGMTRQLYPDLDFWGTSRPFLEGWMKKKHHPGILLKKLKARLPYWLDSLIESTDIKQLHAIMASNLPFNASRQPVMIIEKKPKTGKMIYWYLLSFIVIFYALFLFAKL